MPYELAFAHFNQIEALFETFPHDRAWVDSAFREPGRARAFIDTTSDEQLVLLCLESGDCFLAGEISSEGVATLLNYVFGLEKPQTINFIGLPVVGWSKLIIEQFPQVFAELPRVQLDFDRANFQKAIASLPHLPEGLELVKIDLALAKRIGQELDPDFEEFWPDPVEFLVRGAGLCIMHRTQIASVAYSAFTPYRLFEVAIATHPDFRRQGLASIVSAAVIENCLKDGHTPHWSAEAENEASSHTGKKLGFINERHFMWLKATH